MALSKNNENQLLALFQGGSLGNKNSVPRMRMMAPTVPLVQRSMRNRTPSGFQPMQQQSFPYR